MGHRQRRHHRESGDAEGKNKVSQGETIDKDDTNTVITGESDKNTVTIDTSKGNVDVTFDDLKIDVSGKAEGDGSGDGLSGRAKPPSPCRATTMRPSSWTVTTS